MRIQIIIVGILVAGLFSIAAMAGNGTGDVKLGYCFIDQAGNQSVDYKMFNAYEGMGLSLEKFRYYLQNGLRLNANLRNVTLNNRNMTLGFGKPGLFGVEAFNNQFRRIYDFEGGSFTRRNRTEGSLWFYPQRYVQVFGGGSLVNLSGKLADLYNRNLFGSQTEMDYRQETFNVGIRGNYQGRMLRAEYKALNYKDHKSSDRDQKRSLVRLDGMARVPRFDRVMLTGGFRHFETKYTVNDSKISANTVWGGARAMIVPVVFAGYNFVFDRAGAKTDPVATDNFAQAVFATYENPRKGGVTAEYQFDVRDDFENILKANSFYFTGWCRAVKGFEFRASYGTRAEDVDEGARLLGNEDRNRFQATARYTKENLGSLTLKYEGKQRKNDQIESKADYNQFGVDMSLLHCQKYFVLTVGYSFSDGKYENPEKGFHFKDNIVYGNIETREYYNLTAGFGGQYYRSKRDANVESFSLDFSGGYRILKTYRLEAAYNVYNFDDFLVSDQYSTTNIVEVNLIKELSF